MQTIIKITIIKQKKPRKNYLEYTIKIWKKKKQHHKTQDTWVLAIRCFKKQNYDF